MGLQRGVARGGWRSDTLTMGDESWFILEKPLGSKKTEWVVTLPTCRKREGGWRRSQIT